MACKFIYNNISYSSKEEFIKEVLEKDFLNQPKTLRVQELQQPDFLKFIRKDKDYLKSQGLTDQEVDFLNLLFGDNEKWVGFFIKSLVQNAAKDGYSKIWLPLGNTSAKVEGHTTLEEFKKQKEDRIKELGKQLVPETNQIVTETLSSLNIQLENYLKQFGFNTEQLNDLKQTTGYSIIGATDFLEKTIFVQKENINKAYTKEAAYSIFNLLGRKNLLRKDLIASIHLIDNYESLRSKYLNSKLSDYKIRELIAIDYLQSKLIEAHKEALPTTNKAVSKDVTAKNKLEYTILKIKQWWSNIVRNFFKSYKKGYIEDVFNQIANDVINNNTRLFNLSKEVSYKKMELTGVQKEINDNLVKLGAINSGSYSLNKQGNLTRESINDLDYFLPYEIKDEFIKDVVKKYPQAVFSEPYSGVMGNRSLTLSLKIDDVKIDFFLPTSQEESDNNKIIIIDGIKYHHWKNIFDAKVRIGSKKHLSDLAGFTPFNREWSVHNINWRNPLVLKDDYLNIVGQRHYNFDFIQSKYNSKEYSSLEKVTQSDNIKTYWDKNLEQTALNYFKDNNIDFEKSVQYQDLLSYFNNKKDKAVTAYYLTFSENFKKFYGNIDSRKDLPSFIINSINGNYSKNSVLLDENNEPVIFYHGAGTTFDKFSKDYFLSGEGAMAYGAGFYSTNYKPTADNYRDTAKSAIDTFNKLLQEKNEQLLNLISKLKIDINENTLIGFMMGSLDVEDSKSKTELLNLLGLTETKALYVALTNPLYWQKDISKENKNLIEFHFGIKLKNNNSGQIYRELEKTLKISDKELSARLYQIGIDGVINIAGGGQAVGRFSHKKGEKHVIFFEPVQAKAVNNSGLFSLNNENMYDPIEVKENKQPQVILTKEQKENNTKVNNEITQLKQELERVETEGFGALKPIYNFYENTVTNILKKIFGAQLITTTKFLSDVFTPNGFQIVFGHPTIGKTYLKNNKDKSFITLDDDYADEINSFIDSKRGKETRQEYKGRKPKEYNDFMNNLFNKVKKIAKDQNKPLLISNTNILKSNAEQFDIIINIPKDEFKRRFDARGATYGFEDWKSDIDNTISNIKTFSKITDEYGNTWNEIELKPEYLNEFYLKQEPINNIKPNYNLNKLANLPISNILSHILKNGKSLDVPTRTIEFVKILSDLLSTDKNNNISIELVDNLISNKDNTSIPARFDYKRNVIQINSSRLDSKDYASFVSDLVHELTHSFTLRPWVVRDTKLTAYENKFKQDIELAYKYYNELFVSKNTKDIYGFSSVEEFIAEFKSNPQFRELLSEARVPKSKYSLWDYIKKVLKSFYTKVFGADLYSEEWLDNTIDAYVIDNHPTYQINKTPAIYKAAAKNFFNKEEPSANIVDRIVSEIKRVQKDLSNKPYGKGAVEQMRNLEEELSKLDQESAVEAYLEQLEKIFSGAKSFFERYNDRMTKADTWTKEDLSYVTKQINIYSSYLNHFKIWDSSNTSSVSDFYKANNIKEPELLARLSLYNREITKLYKHLAVKVTAHNLGKGVIEDINSRIKDKSKLITYSMLEERLKYILDDNWAITASLQAAINSKDPISGLIAKHIKDALNGGIEKSVDTETELEYLFHKKYGNHFSAQVDNPEKMYSKYMHKVTYTDVIGKDEFGEDIMGEVTKKAFIMEYDYARYKSTQQAFFNSLPVVPELPDESDPNYESVLEEYTKTVNRRKVLISEWYKANTTIRTDYAELIKRRQAQLSPKDFEAWFSNNTYVMSEYDYERYADKYKDSVVSVDEYGNRYLGRKEFVHPNTKYINPLWNSIKDDTFYRALLKAYTERNKQLPKNSRLKYGVLPQVEKTYGEYLLDGKVLGRNKANENADANKYDQKKSVDSENYLPIYYTRSVDDEYVSNNLLRSVLKFVQKSDEFEALFKINPEIALAKDVIFGSKVFKTDARFVAKTDKNGNVIKADREEDKVAKKVSNINTQLESFLENSYYNITNLDESKTRRATKLLNKLQLATSLKMLAFNPISATGNMLFGEYEIWHNAIMSKYYNSVDITMAHGLVTKSIGANMAIDTKDKVHYLAKVYQAVQGDIVKDFGSETGKSFWSKLFSTNTLFIFQSVPEYIMQASTLVAMMRHHKVKTKSGESISLWDAYESTPTGYKLRDGVNFTKLQKDNFISTLHKINKEMHGNYAKFDKPAFKRKVYGNLIMMFRNHIYEGFQRRFRAEQLDIEAGEYTEGYWLTGGKILQNSGKRVLNLLPFFNFDVKEELNKWSEYTIDQKRAVIQTTVDFALMLSLGSIGGMLLSLAKEADDDDDDFLYFLAIQARKIQTDIAFYTIVLDIDGTLKQLTNPTVTMGLVQNVLQTFKYFVGNLTEDPNDPNQTSYYKRNDKKRNIKKGDSKATKSFTKLVPIYGQWIRENEDVAKWYYSPAIR